MGLKEKDNGNEECKEVKKTIRRSEEDVRQRAILKRIKRCIAGSSAKDFQELEDLNDY